MSGFDETVIQSAQESLFAATENGLKTLGRYEIQRVLGRGGMGLVYLARDPQLDRHVAVKVLTAGALAAPELKARFQKEARAIGHVEHPNVADVFEVGEDDGRPYLVMEYLPNGSLADRIAAQLPTAKQACLYVETLARAVHAAHQNGVVHRDLKPSNVLFAHDDTPKITDFGLAKRLDADDHATATGEILGTPSYMAPEQAAGVVKNVGPACDVYALGAILYELLTGRPPFQSPDPVQTVLMVLSEEPVSVLRLQPHLPRDLATICHKCLEKSPHRRYATAWDLAEDLSRYREGFPIAARPVSRWERWWRWAKRHPTATALMAVSILGVTALVSGGAWHLARMQAELRRSNALVGLGNDFAQWVLGEHVTAVGRLAGSTEAQQALVAHLQEHLDGLAAQAHDDRVLAATIARAYVRIAEVQGHPESFNLGNTAGALENCLKADEFYRRARADRPDDPELKLAHIHCRRMIVQLRRALGQPQDAAEALQSLRGELQPLAQQVADPQRIQLLDSLLIADLAWLDLEAGNGDEARRKFEAAHRKAAAIADRFPQQTQYAGTVRALRNHLAQMYEHLGEYDQALEQSQWLVAQVRTESEKDPTNVLIRQELAQSLIRHGDALSFLRQDGAALKAYRQAEAIRRELLSVDPKNARMQSALVACLDRIATVQQTQREFQAARQTLHEAITVHAALLEQDPRNVEHRRTFWILHNSLGAVHTQAGEFDQAETVLKQSLAVEEELLREDESRTADRQGVAETCHGMAQVCFARAVAEESLQRLQESLHWIDRSLEAYRQIETRGHLSPVQSNRRDAVAKMRSIIEQARQALNTDTRADDQGPVENEKAAPRCPPVSRDAPPS